MSGDKLPIVTREDECAADDAVSAANIVTHDGFYEIDIDAVTTIMARHRIAAKTKAATTITELVSALEECQRALATMVEPNDIRTTTVMNAYALGKQAETRARTALSNTRGDTREQS